jgi:hypothetical protein
MSKLRCKRQITKKRQNITVEKNPNHKDSSQKYELGPKEEDKEEVVSDARKDYTDGFKDLVLSMMQYHFYDRPSIQNIRNHPWLKGEVPT